MAPTAISWLFKVTEEKKEKSGARFSIRVSAVEISGHEEELTDLLAELSCPSGHHQEAPGPTVSLKEDPVYGSQVGLLPGVEVIKFNPTFYAIRQIFQLLVLLCVGIQSIFYKYTRKA